MKATRTCVRAPARTCRWKLRKLPRSRADPHVSRSGGSRGLGRTYFFLELLLLELDLLPLLLLLELDELFFAPPDFEAALAMLFSFSAPLNCRFAATVPERTRSGGPQGGATAFA